MWECAWNVLLFEMYNQRFVLTFMATFTDAVPFKDPLAEHCAAFCAFLRGEGVCERERERRNPSQHLSTRTDRGDQSQIVDLFLGRWPQEGPVTLPDTDLHISCPLAGVNDHKLPFPVAGF